MIPIPSQIFDFLAASGRVAGCRRLEILPAGRSIDPLCGRIRVALLDGGLDDEGPPLEVVAEWLGTWAEFSSWAEAATRPAGA